MDATDQTDITAVHSDDNHLNPRCLPECEQGDHANPYCRCNTSDEERAKLLVRFFDAIQQVWLYPLLILIDQEGIQNGVKRPAIKGECALNDPRIIQYLLQPWEAIAAIHDGHPGFYIYAGRPENRTDDLIIVDRDAPEQWPDLGTTVRVQGREPATTCTTKMLVTWTGRRAKVI